MPLARLTQLLTAILMVVAQVSAHLFSFNESDRNPRDVIGEKMEPLNPKLYEIFSFGQLPAFVDSLWLKFIQDPLLDHVAPGVHPEIYYLLQLATDLDPFYFDAYVSGSNVLSVIRDDGAGARDILAKAEKFRGKQLHDYPESARGQYWQDEWRVPFLLGYVYLFDLNDIQSSATSFKEASMLPKVPSFVSRLADRLSTRAGQFDAGIKLLDHMIAGAKDPLALEKLKQKRASIDVGYYLFELRERFDVFSREGHKKGISDQELWQRFASSNAIYYDPWGGKLVMGPTGKIATSTPHQNVFGLD